MSAERAYQITIDCAEPDTMARFWAAVLGYDLQEPPEPHTSWKQYWVSVGVPEDDAEGYGYDSIVDPTGSRPRIWFQQVPEPKEVKNRLHFDLLVGGGRTVPLAERKQRVREEAKRTSALGATELRVMDNSEYDHFAIAMGDPEGNEFDIV
jgi:hypothetical protein